MSVRLERIIAIDAAIRNGSLPTLRSFMQRFEVSERTIRADLAFLRERLDAPLQYDRARGGYTYTDPTWSLPTMLLSEGDLIAFLLGVELAQRYLGSAFEAPLRKTIERLAASLPHELQVDLSQLAQHYTFQAGAPAGVDPGLLATLFECVRERWRVDMVYFTASSGERKRRVIEPYQLLNVQGNWQVLAFDHLRQQMRQFAVSRIEQWQVLQAERFSRDPDFSVEHYLSTSFLAERGDTAEQIEIWFDEFQTRYMHGREFHASQQVEHHADGSMTLRFQSGALDEIRRWVMSFGPHARVLSPPSLAEAVRDACAATLAVYGEVGR